MNLEISASRSCNESIEWNLRAAPAKMPIRAVGVLSCFWRNVSVKTNVGRQWMRCMTWWMRGMQHRDCLRIGRGGRTLLGSLDRRLVPARDCHFPVSPPLLIKKLPYLQPWQVQEDCNASKNAPVGYCVHINLLNSQRLIGNWPKLTTVSRQSVPFSTW